MTQNHLKYLYQKYSKNLLPNNMYEIYEYSNSISSMGILCQSYQVKTIIFLNFK